MGYKTLFLVQRISFMFVWQYVTCDTNFKVFHTLLDSLNDTSKGILFNF